MSALLPSREGRLTPLLTDAVRARLAAWDTAAAADWKMQPLTVTADLGASVACARLEDLSLDGLLAAELLLDLLGADYFALPAPQAGDALVHVRLPLAVQGPGAEEVVALPSGYEALPHAIPASGALWWWACATPTVEGPTARETQHWHKRFDLKPELTDLLALPANGRIKTDGGRYKSQRRPVQALAARQLRWACVGDLEAMQTLLAGVPALGKHRGQGYGIVRRWTVEAATRDESLWTADGALARPVPLAALPAVGVASLNPVDGWTARPRTEYVGYRVPRWLPAHQTECALGGQRLPPSPDEGTLIGRFFILPHAVDRFRERVLAFRPDISHEEARLLLVQWLDQDGIETVPVYHEMPGVFCLYVREPFRFRAMIDTRQVTADRPMPRVVTVRHWKEPPRWWRAGGIPPHAGSTDLE